MHLIVSFLQFTSSALIIYFENSRWATPYSERLDRNAHSSLIIILLSSSADMADFIEYINIPEIVDYFDGIHPIMGNF